MDAVKTEISIPNPSKYRKQFSMRVPWNWLKPNSVT